MTNRHGSSGWAIDCGDPEGHVHSWGGSATGAENDAAAAEAAQRQALATVGPAEREVVERQMARTLRLNAGTLCEIGNAKEAEVKLAEAKAFRAR